MVCFDAERMTDEMRSRGLERGLGYYALEVSGPDLFLAGEAETESAGIDRGQGVSGVFSPGSLSSAQRMALIEEIEAGKVFSLTVDVIAFRDVRNAKDVVVAEGHMEYLAGSALSAPQIRDHRLGDSKSRIGTIHSGRLKGKDLILTAEFTERDAMKQLVRGEITEFSAGIRAAKEDCSICDKQLEMFYGYPFMRCEHRPGRKYDGKLCQVRMYQPRLLENSVVNRGAVPGTRVLSLSDFSNWRDDEMSKQINDTEQTKADPVAEPEATPGPSEDFTALQTELSAAKKSIVDLTAANEALRKEMIDLSITAAVDARKLKPADEKWLRGEAEQFGLDFVKRYLATRDADATLSAAHYSQPTGANPPPPESGDTHLSLVDEIKARRAAEGQK